MSHDHAAHGHGGAHGAGQGGYTHAGHGYGGAPKGYAVQHSAADENRRGREEGETLHYALYTVFARSGARPAESNTDEARAEFEKVAEQLAADGVTLRGIYDVSAMRDNADVMIWTHGATPKSCRQQSARSAAPHSSQAPLSSGPPWAYTAKQNSPATTHPPTHAARHPKHGSASTPSYAPTTGTT